MLSEVLATIANLALTLFTITSLLALGMSLTVTQIIDPLRNHRQLIVILLGNFVLTPLLAMAITLVFPLGDDQKTALILLGVMAGAAFLPLLVQMAKGHMPLAVGTMVLITVVSIFFAPLVLPLLLTYVQVDALAIAQPLILLMLFPLVIGLLIKWRYADAAARFQPHVSQVATFSLFLLFAAGVPPALSDIIGKVGTFLITATLALTIGAVLIGYLLATGTNGRKRKAMALGTGQRNLTGALVVAADVFGPDVLVNTLVASIILTVAMLLIAAEWGRRTGDTSIITVDS